MILFKEAYDLVLDQVKHYGEESVDIKEAIGRILAEDIRADRDFPPFNRSTKDGIAINFGAIKDGINEFEITGILAAGVPVMELADKTSCIEIMTGAIVPDTADTVIMYEHLVIKNGYAKVQKIPVQGANVHAKGSDDVQGAVVLKSNSLITPAAIGVLAAVGKARVKVKNLPTISVISTGRELVEIAEEPLPHQIRRSNVYSLFAALSKDKIQPLLLHINDDKDIIRQKLTFAIQEMDVLLLSGGVSKGKFDFLPEVLDDLGVEKIFHRVKQRPGKPFWFGVHPSSNTVIFSFPGNPVSTFVNYHVYFRPWLYKSLGIALQEEQVILVNDLSLVTDLTCFFRVRIHIAEGRRLATLVHGNGSGDLISLANIDGFIRLDPKKKTYKKGALVPYIPTTSQY